MRKKNKRKHMFKTSEIHRRTKTAIGQDVHVSKLPGRRRKGVYRRAKSGGSGVQGFGIPSLTRVFRATRGEWLEVSESR